MHDEHRSLIAFLNLFYAKGVSVCLSVCPYAFPSEAPGSLPEGPSSTAGAPASSSEAPASSSKAPAGFRPARLSLGRISPSLATVGWDGDKIWRPRQSGGLGNLEASAIMLICTGPCQGMGRRHAKGKHR